MSLGSWLLLVFTLQALAYFWVWLPDSLRTGMVARLRLPRVLDRDMAASRPLLAAMGLPVCLGVAIYTDVLLGAVQARPFWNANLVAQLFLFSALSTGCAAVILALSASRKLLDTAQIRFLYTLDICLNSLSSCRISCMASCRWKRCAARWR